MTSFDNFFHGTRILVTGGTGTLGKNLVNRLIAQKPAKIRVFSRDEEKQWAMQQNLKEHQHLMEFQIGDIRSFSDVVRVLQDVDIVFNAAALKQVPSCENFPYQAVLTNCTGAENIVQAIEQFKLPVKIVCGISTDKACSPVNAMGISKAMQEKIFIGANLRCPETRFVCSRYGNILGSRGSLIPLFHSQIKAGRNLTVTDKEMTRFLMSINEAIDLIFKAVTTGWQGETFLPKTLSSRVIDIAEIFSEKYNTPINIIGIRPGEKLHEILINEEESNRIIEEKDHYIVVSSLDLPIKRPASGRKINLGSNNPDNLVDKATVAKKLESENLLELK
jgi:FlaA1/EpsC-like NDP-sugar epimerase